MLFRSLAIAFGGGSAAEAQQPVSSLNELWMRIKSGDRVFVTDGSGRETAGVFAQVSASTLSLVVDGQLHDIPSVDIREIAKRGDSVWNGFLIGASVGAVLGALTGAAVGCEECDEPVSGAAELAVGQGIFFGGVGALIDYLIKGRTVAFRVSTTALRFRPVLSVGQRGVHASMVVSF